MKRFPIFFLPLICALFAAPPAHSQSGPVAHFKFNELPGATVVNDAAGSFSVGVPSGITFVGGGIEGNAMQLDGSTNAFLNLGNSIIDTTQSFAVSMWIQLANGDPRSMNPWSKYRGFSGFNGALGFIGTYQIVVNNVTNTVPNPGRATFFMNGASILTTPKVVNDGAWHHLVFTYDAANRAQRFYADGALVGTLLNVTNNASAESFLIGGGTSPAGVNLGAFAGLMDEVQIYRRNLAAEEVSFLFTNPELNASGGDLPGNIDHKFVTTNGFANVGVKPVSIRQIAPLSNGRLLIGGSFATYGGSSTPNFARINPDGTLDTTFFHGFGASAEVLDFAVQSDGNIVVVGAFDAFHEILLPRVARLTADGFPDRSFRPGNGADHNVHTVALQSDGKILLGGAFSNYDSTNRPGIARLLNNGKLDLSFDPGTGFAGYVNDIAVSATGQIYAGGSFTNYNGTARNALVRLNADGTLDSTFNAPFEATAEVREIVVRPNGQVVAVGVFSLTGANGRRNAVRLNADGSLDASFGSSGVSAGPDGPINAVAVCADGSYLMAGDFLNYDGLSRIRLARVGTNGLVDNAPFFLTQQQTFTNVINLTNTFNIISTNFPPSTNILFGYVSNFQFITVTTNTAPGFATTNFVTQSNIVGSADIAVAANTNASYFGNGAGVNGTVQAIALTSADVPYIGGAFSSVYGVPRAGLAKLRPCAPGAGAGLQITGTLIDATTGGPIAGATVTTFNEIAFSSGSGVFNLLNAVSGPNQLLIQAPGYFPQTNTVVVTNQVTQAQFVLSPGITDSNTIRLVLTWGAEPSDLDSHIDVPSIQGQPGQTVFFGNRGSLTSIPFTELDVDNVFGFGPETITITNVFPGIYNYFIHRFSGNPAFGFSNSQARVEIFTSAGRVGTINVPTSGVPGDYWHVLQLNGTNRSFAVINAISNGVPTISTNVTYSTTFASGVSQGGTGPAKITTQPGDVFGIAGQTATLSAIATGVSPLSFQWLKDGSAVPGQTSSSITFTNLSLADAGEYQLVVTNVLGAVTSQVARVTALSSSTPFVYLQPEDVVVDVGGTATFEAIGGGARPLFYQWRHDGNVVANAGGPILSITNVQPGDGGAYQMTLANTFGTVFSKQVNLLVATPPVITNFTFSPSNRVSAGQTVTLTVEAEGKGPLEYIWLFNGTVLPSELARSLTLQSAHFTNAGDYTVIVTNLLGSVTNPPVTLTVDSPPIITVQPQNQFQTIGRAASLSVAAIGSAPLAYQWLKDGALLAGQTTTQLSITNVQASDVGLYSVVVSNSFGVVTSRLARVDVVLERALVPWVQSFGGAAADAGQAVAVDASGNSYVVGRFAGTAQFGTNTLVSAGLEDFFIARLDIDGNVVWARRFGGPGFDAANAIAADTNGNIFVTGSFEGVVDFGGTTLTNTNATSFGDLFVARYDNTGNLVWVRREGDPFVNDAGQGIAIDASLNVYVAGSSPIGSFGGAALTNDGRILLARYDANGNRSWARKAGASVGGSQLDTGTGVAVDAAGNVLLSATFQSPSVTSAGVTLTNRGFSDGFVAKFDPAGAQQWIRQVGSLSIDSVAAVAASGTDSVIVGQFTGTNDFGGRTLVSAGGSLPDGFVVKLDSSGGVIWAQRLGGPGSDGALDVSIDALGGVYITGFFQGNASFGEQTSISIAATTDIFAARLRADGTFEFVQQAGGDDVGGESGRGIAVDAAGNGVFVGAFRGTLVAGGASRTSSGGDDVFVSRLVAPPLLSVQVSGGQIIFSWPSFWTGFGLEENDSSLSSTNWAVSASTPTNIGDRFYITNSFHTNLPAKFYRLRRP